MRLTHSPKYQWIILATATLGVLGGHRAWPLRL